MTVLFTIHVTMSAPTMYHLNDEQICPSSVYDDGGIRSLMGNLSCRMQGVVAWIAWLLSTWRVIAYACDELDAAIRMGLPAYFKSTTNKVRAGLHGCRMI